MSALHEVLHFAAGGKLERICLAGAPNLLHEWPWDVQLDGTAFRPAGWDECFPTIEAYGDCPVMGELVAQAPALTWAGAGVEQVWQGRTYEARRRFALVAPRRLDMTFSVTNDAPRPMEFLWASHALFPLQGLQAAQCRRAEWLRDFAADRSERKLFVPGGHPVQLVYSRYRLMLTTDQPWWGIWINRGGWPADAPEPLCCVGIEATNTPAEQPKGQWLAGGATFWGKVKLELHLELST
jgi:hypothetical protein